MSGSAPGYARRPDEPQCYNCGVMGHWAVACPEPTRQTPAGLEAWRSASNTGGHNKDHRGGQKKSKGPIITRYAPPPAPAATYPPHSGYHAPPGQYPAPLPPYSQPQPPHYPQPPPPSHYPPYPQSTPPYPPGYQQSPGYPPQAGPPGAYVPAPHVPPARLPDYSGQPPPPPPPPPPHQATAPYPQPYTSYSSGVPTGGPPVPPRLPGSLPGPSTPGYGFKRSSHPSSQTSTPQSSHKSRLQNQSPAKKPHSSTQAPSSLPHLPHPPTLPGAGEPVKHGLPPKPPAPNRDRADTRRDNKSKKRHDRQRGNRESRHKDHAAGRRTSGQKPHQHNRRRSSQGHNAAGPTPPRSQESKAQPDDIHNQESEKPESKQESAEPPKLSIAEPGESRQRDHEASNKPGEDGGSDSEWEINAIFKEPEKSHPPDEVGKPLPGIYNEDVLLPRKWDAPCIESEFIRPENLGEFARPIHETEHWQFIEFDPAFVRDGKLPSGEPLSELSKTRQALHEQSSQVGVGEARDYADHQGPGQLASGSDGQPRSDKQPKRKRSPDESPISQRERRDSHVTDSLWDSLGPPPGKSPQPDSRRGQHPESSRPDPLGQPHQYESSPRGESPCDHQSRPLSRRSSVSSSRSSHSSGLDSLDKELLGIETKDRRQSDTDRSLHERRETERVPKPKRRRVQVDSAYSRRW